MYNLFKESFMYLGCLASNIGVQNEIGIRTVFVESHPFVHS